MYDEKEYFLGKPTKKEQMAWDREMLRYGDQCCALGYAFGLSSFFEVRDVFGFKEDGKLPEPVMTAKEQVERLYHARRRTPRSVLDVGGGRGELAAAFAYCGIKTQMVEPSKAVFELVGETRRKYGMPQDFEVINSSFADALPRLNKDIDTIIFCESIEHIPVEEFEQGYNKIMSFLRERNWRVIIVNWIDFHPIFPSDDFVEHCWRIDDNVYDVLTKGGRRLFQAGSHLVYRNADVRIPYFSPPSFDVREKEAVSRYFDDEVWVSEFTHTRELEKKIAEFARVKYCAMVPSCTTALAVSLWAFGVKPGDEVIVPDYTMAGTAVAVRMAGGTPVLVDVEKETMGMSLQSLKDQVTDKTKAVILVSMNGRYPNTVGELIDFCEGKAIPVIEDAAQALGSLYNGMPMGTNGDVGCFSFSPFKTVSFGQGGALVTDNEILYENIKKIKDFGRDGNGSDSHASLGFNFHYTDLQALIGLEQMKKLPYRIRRKKQILRLYIEYLKDHVRFFDTQEENNLWLNDILVSDPKALAAHLRKNYIDTRSSYPGLHTQQPFLSKRGFPNSEYGAGHILYLPSSPLLTDDEVLHVSRLCIEGLKS